MLIKVVLRQERILVLCFRTTLMKGFAPLLMSTSLYLIVLKCKYTLGPL